MTFMFKHCAQHQCWNNKNKWMTLVLIPYEFISRSHTIIIVKLWPMKFVMHFIFLMVIIGCGKTKAIILLWNKIKIHGIPSYLFISHMLKNLYRIIIVTKVYEIIMLHNIITILKNLELFLMWNLFIYNCNIVWNN
jgi:hypothetical protein